MQNGWLGALNIISQISSFLRPSIPTKPVLKSFKSPISSQFADMLELYQYGILNHCDYPIHNEKLEGVNNKIKDIKHKAYGFHDLRYSTLKIYRAVPLKT